MGGNQFVEKFVILLSGSLNRSQTDEARKKINLELVGDEAVNEYNKDMVLVGKYNDHPNANKLLKAHQSLARGCACTVYAEVGIDSSGRLHFIRIING